MRVLYIGSGEPQTTHFLTPWVKVFNGNADNGKNQRYLMSMNTKGGKLKGVHKQNNNNIKSKHSNLNEKGEA